MLGPKPIEIEVPNEGLIVSHTDLRGIITYANDTFQDISGYNGAELIGKPHNILRHPDMPSSLFENLWDTIKNGRMWSGYVKNKTKNGGYYWVYAQVSSLFDADGSHIGYKSLRQAVPKTKRNELEESYITLKEIEEGKMKLNIWVDRLALSRLLDESLYQVDVFEKKLEEILKAYEANGRP
ncbi:MAG TPA: PAS domain-containing protein [Campylobacterales bacterium]|nr:PAS domain-containing protein [Campylobacterales bacterium]